MTDTAQNGRVASAKKDYEWAVAILGAIVSTPPVIALIQKGFHVELNWRFSEFIHYYQLVFTPVIDLVQWPVRFVLQLLRIDIVIPQWLKDLHAISFVLAGIFVRGWASKIGRHVLEGRLRWESEHDFAHLDERALAKKMRWRRFTGLVVYRLRMTALALFLGFTGLGLVAWLLVPVGAFVFTLIMTFATMNSDARRESSWPHIRQRFKKRMKQEWAIVTSYGAAIVDVAATAGATAIAVAAFYLSNETLPLLGLS